MFNMVPKLKSWYNRASLWYDQPHDWFYEFGGEHSKLSPIRPDLSIWKYDLDNGTWALNTTMVSPPWSEGMTRPSGGASATTKDAAFYLGGYSNGYDKLSSQVFVSRFGSHCQ